MVCEPGGYLDAGGKLTPDCDLRAADKVPQLAADTNPKRRRYRKCEPGIVTRGAADGAIRREARIVEKSPPQLGLRR